MHWTQLIKTNALVLGLSHLGRSAVGVAWRPRPDSSALQRATIVRAESLPPIASSLKITSVVLSTATLVNTRRLELRRAGERCVGLLVSHYDGSTDALGAWDPADTGGVITIYEASEDGSLEGIAFGITDYQTHYSVTDVIALTGSLAAPDGYRVFSVTVSDFPPRLLVDGSGSASLLIACIVNRMVVWQSIRRRGGVAREVRPGA